MIMVLCRIMMAHTLLVYLHAMLNSRCTIMVKAHIMHIMPHSRSLVVCSVHTTLHSRFFIVIMAVCSVQTKIHYCDYG